MLVETTSQGLYRIQITRLNAAKVEAFNRVFLRHRDLFDHFGCEIMEPGR